ncbi:hypothetical protein PTKIN_Ptkin10aG0054800 [Pterospermum kingtungense]
MGNFIGTYIEYDANNKASIWRIYMRIKVGIDVNILLVPYKMIKKKDGNLHRVNFKYEHLGSFCFIYGLLDHIEKSCPKLFEAYGAVLRCDWNLDLCAPLRSKFDKNKSRWLHSDYQEDFHGGARAENLLRDTGNHISENLNVDGQLSLPSIRNEEDRLDLGDDREHRRAMSTDKAQNLTSCSFGKNEMEVDVSVHSNEEIVKANEVAVEAQKSISSPSGKIKMEVDAVVSLDGETSRIEKEKEVVDNGVDSQKTSFFIGWSWFPNLPEAIIVLSWNAWGLGKLGCSLSYVT